MAPLIAATLYFDNAGKMKAKTICKGLCSLCFVLAAALTFTVFSSSVPRILILTALICGFAGDVFLAYQTKNEKLQSGLDAAGMLTFIAGHIMFAAAFFMQTERFKLALFAVLLGLPLIVILLFSLRLLETDKAFMQVGALIYSLVIGVTLTAAINLRIYNQTLGATLTLIGTVLFATSDLILAFLTYNKKISRKAVFPFVLIVYYLGQAFIAMSLAY